MSHIFFTIIVTIICAGNVDHFLATGTIDSSSDLAQNDLTFVEHCKSDLLRLESYKDCLYKELKASYTAHEINVLYYVVKKLILLPKCVKNIGKSIVKNKIDEIWGYQKQIFDEMHAMSKIYDILRPKDITLTRGYTEWCMFGVEHLLTDDTEQYQSSSDSNLTREYEIDQITILHTMYKLRHENACKKCGKEVSEEMKTKLVVIDLYVNNRELFEKNTATVRDLLKRYDEFDDCNNGNSGNNVMKLFGN